MEEMTKMQSTNESFEREDYVSSEPFVKRCSDQKLRLYFWLKLNSEGISTEN